jgi:FkbM family methyltransferase
VSRPFVEDFLLVYVPQQGRGAIDVGANAGDWTAALAERFETVYAVEPNPALAPALNAIAPNVTAIELGAWDKAERRTFTLYASDKNTSAHGFRGGLPDNAEYGSVDWDCAPLDELIHSPVDFIKMDVEAAEVEALKGATGIIERDRPHLLIEIHGNDKGDQVVVMLEGLGYSVSMIRNPMVNPALGLWQINYWLVGDPNGVS